MFCEYVIVEFIVKVSVSNSNMEKDVMARLIRFLVVKFVHMGLSFRLETCTCIYRIIFSMISEVLISKASVITFINEGGRRSRMCIYVYMNKCGLCI